MIGSDAWLFKLFCEGGMWRPLREHLKRFAAGLCRQALTKTQSLLQEQLSMKRPRAN